MSLTGTFVIRAIRPSVLAFPMLLVLQQLAEISAAIRPHDDTLALLLTTDVLTLTMSKAGTFVRLAIRPSFRALPMLPTILPLADVHSAIRPREGTLPMLLTILPLADVPSAIRPREDTLALLLIINVLT
jgi:hypothetical protein